MSLLADHIAALIIEIANTEQNRRFSFFMTDLPSLLKERYLIAVPESLAEVACDRLEKLGGCEKLYSPLTGDMYQIDASAALYFFGSDAGPSQDTSTEYDRRHDRINDEFKIIKTYYSGGLDWVERVVKSLVARNLFEDESSISDDPTSEFAPASDRIVMIDHNSREIEDVRNKLDDLSELIRHDNSNLIANSEDKRRFIEQFAAARDLLKLPRVSTKAIGGLVLTALTYLTVKFADQAIGQIAEILINLLKTQLGITL
jgi:hypothetical protein